MMYQSAQSHEYSVGDDTFKVMCLTLGCDEKCRQARDLCSRQRFNIVGLKALVISYQDAGPFPAVFVETSPGILSKNMIFS